MSGGIRTKVGMEPQVQQKVKEMTRKEVIVRAIAKEITWIEAAWICGITARHMHRLKDRYLAHGHDGLGPIPPSTLWTAASAIVDHPTYALDEPEMEN